MCSSQGRIRSWSLFLQVVGHFTVAGAFTQPSHRANRPRHSPKPCHQLGHRNLEQKYTKICLSAKNPPILGIFLNRSDLVGGFNPFEKYCSKWESSPNRVEHEEYLSCHQLEINSTLIRLVTTLPQLAFFDINQRKIPSRSLSRQNWRIEALMIWVESWIWSDLRWVGVCLGTIYPPPLSQPHFSVGNSYKL